MEYQRIYSSPHEEHRLRLKYMDGFFQLKGYWAKIIYEYWKKAIAKETFFYLILEPNARINLGWKEKGHEKTKMNDRTTYKKYLSNVSKPKNPISFLFDANLKGIRVDIFIANKWFSLRSIFKPNFQKDQAILTIIPNE